MKINEKMHGIVFLVFFLFALFTRVALTQSLRSEDYIRFIFQIVFLFLIVFLLGSYAKKLPKLSKMNTRKMRNISWVVGIVIFIAILLYVNMPSKVMNKVAVFETNQGTFKIELYLDKAPITAGNFLKLAEQGFYNGTRFHRVIPKFMIQGGDPLSKDISKKDMWGTGGPGYAIKDEFGQGLKNDKGTIAMANSGPNTGGSQFFINVANNNFLDGKHPVFGKVIEGYDVVEKISNLKTNPGDAPVQDVIIKSIKIVALGQ